MLTRAEGRRQRAAIMKDISRAEKARAKAELAELRAQLKAAYAAKKGKTRAAIAACRAGRKAQRARAKARRAELLAKLAAETLQEKQAALAACDLGIASARSLVGRHASTRAKLEAERRFRAELRRIEAQNRARKSELTPKKVARDLQSESDDEVRANIPPELRGLFERVKRSVKGTGYKSRTEAFLHYAEENPAEVFAGIDDETERLIRELAARERAA
jgi:hypothetical protein